MYGVNCVCTWPWAYRTYYSYLLSNSLYCNIGRKAIYYLANVSKDC